MSKSDPSGQKILTFSKKDLNACFTALLSEEVAVKSESWVFEFANF